MYTRTINVIGLLLLFTCQSVHSAAISQLDDLSASIDEVQRRFTRKKIEKNDEKLVTDPENNIETDRAGKSDYNDEEDQLKLESVRHNKMLDYYGIYPQQYLPQYAIYPEDFYEDYDQQNIDDDELMSRANRRRPSSSNRNSPIFYIRLPPTPYMFVPGMGYISQPPTIQPLAPQYQLPQPVSPFINVPVNFVANGKPTNVYQWNAAAAAAAGVGSFGPQFPSYLPARPQRPFYRPTGIYTQPQNQKPGYQQPLKDQQEQQLQQQDSKITHLKGQFVFNGRPEEVFILPNSPYLPASPFTSPYNTPFTAPYTSPYNAIYSNPLQNYY